MTWRGFNPNTSNGSRKDGVGIITLNRPERKNPLTFESYAELRDFFRALVGVKEVRALVITGAGGNFCSGGDVHEIIGPLTRMDAAGLRNFTKMTGDLVKAMRACPQPIVAAVDGVCAGAGAILAMAADFRLGTPRAKTAFSFHACRIGRVRYGRLRDSSKNRRAGARLGVALHRPFAVGRRRVGLGIFQPG